MADAKHALRLAVDGRELLDRPTGVGRYLSSVLKAWHAHSPWPHTLGIFVPRDPSAAMRVAWPRAEWVVVPSPTAGTRWEQTRLPRALRTWRADALFAAGYTAPLFSPCPFVVTIHDVSFFARASEFRPRERWRRQWLTRETAKRASSVVTVSEFSAQEIARWLHIDRRRIRVASQGAPAVPVDPPQTAREPLVLFVGSLFKRRHIPDLIEGFALAQRAVPAARLRIIGDNRTNPPIDVRQLAARSGVADAVEWLDYVDDETLEDAYRAARVFAFLSDYEGFAMTPLEAIAHGAPAVLLDTPVAREIYGDGAVLVPPDPHRIGEAIERLLRDPAAHADALARGLARRARYSWTATANVILDALADAARP